MLNNIYTFFKNLLIITIALGILVLFIITVIPSSMIITKTKQTSEFIIQKANANEIYPEFICGCCGKALDPKNICCGMAQNLIDYIKMQAENNLSKDQIIINTVKEFGFNSLAKDNTKSELKSKLAQNAPMDAPRIVFDNKFYDFGRDRKSTRLNSSHT